MLPIHSFICGGLPLINYHPPQIDFYISGFAHLPRHGVVDAGYGSDMFPALPISASTDPAPFTTIEFMCNMSHVSELSLNAMQQRIWCHVVIASVTRPRGLLAALF